MAFSAREASGVAGQSLVVNALAQQTDWLALEMACRNAS